MNGSHERDSRSDYETVAALVREAGSSFYRGMRVLPKERRAAMYALYAFCRKVDDIADGPEPMEAKRAALDAWRARIDALYAGASDDAVTRVLAAAVPLYGLRREDFLAIVDGMQMDAEAPIVAPALKTLDLYCDRVAAAVGRLSVRIFGDASPAADRVANALGRALQLTNILRDLVEDAERGRLYLPREWLEAAHVPADPAAALAAPGLPLVCARTAALAHNHFDQAAEAMRACDARAMRPARLMKETYAAILARLERRGWQAIGEPVSVPAWQKLWLALRHGLV
jgi:presqualene diphosphate synthase